MVKQKLDTYLRLCTEVYEISKPNAPEDDYNFYRSYAADAKGLILEPMCGTGRFLLPLLAEGFDVHGFDASKHMLSILDQKAKLQNLNPIVWEGFVEDLNRSDRYSLIFIPSGSLGLIINLEVAKKALETFYHHLNDDGVLVFELETLQAAPAKVGIWNGSVWRRSDGKAILFSSLELPLENNLNSSIGRYELIDGNDIVRTEIEDFKFRLYDATDVISMLKDVGFKNIRTIKPFNRDMEPDIIDTVIVYECRK